MLQPRRFRQKHQHGAIWRGNLSLYQNAVDSNRPFPEVDYFYALECREMTSESVAIAP